MPDSPDQIIHGLQQKNNRLKKTLKQKDKELSLERHLWSSRESSWDPSNATNLHRIEVFDGVISGESSLHSATLCSRKEFRYILERTEACAIASGDMPLFRDDESRASDPGNRCKLRFRHALLMSLIRKKDNPTQGTLQAIFGVDQTSVCRYLKVMDRILASVLPTAKNVSKEIAACETKEEFKRIVSIPPNKSARSQQWETGNRPSDLNKACLAAKSSLIRTAQTDHEIQADAQDSQD